LLDWGTGLAAVLGFTALVDLSARTLVRPNFRPGLGRADRLLTLAVVGASASQLLVPRWLDLAEPVLFRFVLLSLAPVALQAFAVRLPLLHIPGAVCRAVGFVTFFHFLGGELAVDESNLGPRLLALAGPPAGAVGWAALAVLLALLGEGLARFGTGRDAVYQL